MPFCPSENFLMKTQQVLSFVVLLLPVWNTISFTFSCTACSSNWSSGTSMSLLFESITNSFDPWEITPQEWVLSLLRENFLISTPCSPCKQLVVTSNTGPIFVFPWIHPLGCDVPSSLRRVSCSHWAQLIAPSPHHVAPICRERFHILHTSPRLLRKDWADSKKQLCEKSFNCCLSGSKKNRQISMSFASELPSGKWSRSTEKWTSAFGEFHQHLLYRYCPRFLVDCTLWGKTTFSQSRDQCMTIVLFQPSLHTRVRLERVPYILVHCLSFHRKCRWTST